ncbi:hypothetical protein F4861DRAFT_542739 [Xylaria intraflava]|nr:hypothetical protein F4861DRAFT_542739 [Xylaria intraflava]
MIFRVFWDTGDKRVRSNAVISSDVNFFQRGRHINRKSIKYHQAVPLLIHGFTARVLALVLGVLRDKGHINVPTSDLDVSFVKGLMADLDPDVLDSAMEEVWASVFTREGWTGRYPGVTGDDVDTEFRSQCRLLQVVEVLLTVHEAVRHGDYGMLRDVIPQLPILFWGGRSSNYGPEMLYFAWLLHPAVSDEHVRDAILQGGLIRCVTSGSGYKSIDLMLEHVNAGYALDIKHNRNSTHDIRATFTRLALNGNYLATIRKSVEHTFGVYAKGTHKGGDATLDIVSYACKLYKDGMADRKPQPGAFDVEDIYSRGQRIILDKLGDFNCVVPEDDEANQAFVVGLGGPESQDGIVDGDGEGQRLFEDDEADNFWGVGLEDMATLE